MLADRKYGNYKMKKLIGAGGYGEVHLALNCEDNKEYAIKIMDKNKIINENLDNNIKSEVQLLRQVEHPFIVRLIEVMATLQKILLVMEYVEGGDLFDAIKEEPNSRMSEDKARLYFQQIIMAIDYCHKLNILHRDLKPENILLDKTNNCIKISDFGLAQSINSKDEIISDIAGTTSYLAPEVIKQTGYTGQSADIWSTGVILFNCVTGTFPFFSKEPGNLINVILEGNVRYPDYLSTEIVDLLKKIFVVNPKYRFNVEQIIEHPWFQNHKIFDIQALQEKAGKDKSNNIVHVTTCYEFQKRKSAVDSIYMQKDFILKPQEIPMITCFELTAMLSGNLISNIFEKNKSASKNFEKLIYKFIILNQFEASLNLIHTFFNEKERTCEFSSLDKGRILIDLYIKKMNIKFTLHLYRINVTKYVFVFSHNQGDKQNFQKLMKSFFDVNKNNFSLF